MLQKIFEDIDKLNLENKADFIYCHCSLKGLNISISDSLELIDKLVDKYSKKTTLVIPTFPFGTSKEYAEYLSSSVTFYPDSTPAKINFFGEFARRNENFIRSSHPILPVCACGPRASWLIDKEYLETDFLGDKMALGRLINQRTYILGLGVNCGTNSFFHYLDMPFENCFPVSHSAKVKATVIDNNNRVLNEDYYYSISSELRKKINPFAFHEIMKDEEFYTYNNDPYSSYVINLKPFIDFGVKYASKQYNKGEKPVWWK
jgi:aminoglycoside N3'-acetyltransferase